MAKAGMLRKVLILVLVGLATISSASSSIGSDIDPKYKGALDTLFEYWDSLNANELSEERMRDLFSEEFCFVGQPNLFFNNISETTGFYNAVRNEVYPAICSPYDFEALKIMRISYLPVEENSVLIGLIDVFLTTPNQTPRVAMAFAYNLVFDENKGKWLMNSLLNFSVDSYPTKWKQLAVEPRWKYNNQKPVEELRQILAREVSP